LWARFPGASILEKLDQGQGNFEIRDVKYDGPGGLVLKPANHPQLGFPSLETVVPGINMSYKEYLAKLAELDKEIQGVHAATDDLLNKEKEVTERLLGEVDKDGNPVRDKSGAVVQPGWRYLVEAERQLQRELQKELEHVEPLWLNELGDVGQAKARRDILIRRLNELVGERGYLSESEFLKKVK